jgi:hypothetical protein
MMMHYSGLALPDESQSGREGWSPVLESDDELSQIPIAWCSASGMAPDRLHPRQSSRGKY